MYLADTRTPQAGVRDVTAYEGTTVRFQQNFPDRPADFLLMHNRRDPRVFDLYLLDVLSGEETLVFQNPGNVSRYYTDGTGTVIAVRRELANGRWSLDVPQDGAWQPIASGTVEDTLWIEGHPLPGTGWAWAVSNLQRDRLALVRLDLETGTESVIHEDPGADIDSVLEDALSYELMAARSMPGHVEVKTFDPGLSALVNKLADAGPFDFKVTSWTHDRTALTLTVTRDTQGAAPYLFDRTNGELTLLADPPAAQYAEHLSTMSPVRLTARDGLELNGYLTLPRGVEAKNLPMVLRVHGGPFTRDRWGYQADDQMLANRGYAVLRVNYRGSTGFGRRFMSAAKRQFARKMHDDLIDAVHWAVKRGIADPDRVAIYGHSFGGYASLVGMTMTPDVFAAGINVVGVSDLAAAFKTAPAYWKNGLARWHEYVGRLTDPHDVAEMAERSPINHAQNIRNPILVVHGANDVRVVQAHSDTIVAAARANGAEVDYIVFADEGHAIRKSQNKLRFARAMERFLARHLGGRAELRGQRKASVAVPQTTN